MDAKELDKYCLVVTISQVTFLQEVQDVYCSVQYNNQVFKTKTVKAQHPQWDESFVFNMNNLNETTFALEILTVELFKKDKKDKMLGFAMMKTDSIELDRSTIFIQDLFENPVQLYTSAIHVKCKIEKSKSKSQEPKQSGFLKKLGSFTMTKPSSPKNQDKFLIEGKVRHIFEKPSMYEFKYDLYENDIEFNKMISLIHDSNAIHFKGIFRVETGKSQIQKAISLLHESMMDDTVQHSFLLDPYVSCSLLKEYLAWLPSPIIDEQFYSNFVKLSKIVDMQAKIQSYRSAIQGLPLSSHLGILLNLLAKIHKNSKVNLMNAHHLALVLAWNIIGSEKQQEESILLNNYKQSIIIVEDLILLYDMIKDVWGEKKPTSLGDAKKQVEPIKETIKDHIQVVDITQVEIDELDDLRDFLTLDGTKVEEIKQPNLEHKVELVKTSLDDSLGDWIQQPIVQDESLDDILNDF